MRATTKTKLPSTPVGRRRLLKLAGLLEKDASDQDGVRFDLGFWGRSSDEAVSVSCNTTACACGLAAISGAFAKEGLGYRLTRNEWTDGCEIKITLNGVCRDGRVNDGSFISIMKFFSLSVEQAEYMFTRYPYIDEDLPTTGAEGERAVAKRIRDFVAGRAAP